MWRGSEPQMERGKKKKSKTERRGLRGVGGRKWVKITSVRDRASETGSRSGCVVGRPENERRMR